MDNSRQVQLEKIKLFAQTYFNDALIGSDVDLNISFKPILDSWMMVLRVQMLGEKVWRYPSTWWDAFKDRWFPGWLKKRFPVEYIEISVVYPELMKKISLPKEPHHLIQKSPIVY